MMCNTREWIKEDCPERAERKKREKEIFCHQLKSTHLRITYDCYKIKKIGQGPSGLRT